MKIAILYELLGRSRGGIEAWIYHASEELLKQGHEVTIYNIQQQTPSDAAPAGAKIITLKKPAKIPGINFVIHVLTLRKQLRSELHKYDIVWARSFTMAWAASKIIKNVVYINAAPHSYYDGQVTFKEYLKTYRGFLGFLRIISIELSLMFSWLIERSAIKKCLNVYLSKSRQDQTLSFFKIKYDPSKFFVIPAGVNTKRFHPVSTGWNGIGILKLISVCRFSPDKNIQCVIHALAKLIKDSVPVHLTIVGEGYFENELRRLVNVLGVNKYIDFVGRQENIEEWYRQNHVFVLPSLYEGFGSVYVEAMASGLPCIAINSKSGKYSVAADEIIDHSINGLLMQENDPDELSMLIKSIHEHPQILNNYAKEARSKVIKHFTWENTVTRLLEINKCHI